MSTRSAVVVVTGLSGAGKSTALRALEDLGYFCVDNLPPTLLSSTVDVCEEGGIRRIGLGIDVRVGSFFDGAVSALDHIIEQSSRDVRVLFLDASDEILIRRFSETRRPHPLSGAAGAGQGLGAVAVLDGIQFERERLSPLRARATMVVDTTRLSVHDLRRRVIDHLGPGKAEQPRMVTRFVSFGFKYGLPVDADLVFDVRLLDNPFFVPHLRHLAGTDLPVREYVLASSESTALLEKLYDLLVFTLPRYEREGKSYLTIAIGCTGGRHRSVTVAEVLAERLREKTGLPVLVHHRDVGRASVQSSIPPPQMPRGDNEGEDK